MLQITGMKCCKNQSKIRIGIGIDKDDLFIAIGDKHQLCLSTQMIIIRFSGNNIIISLETDCILYDEILSGVISKYSKLPLEQKLIDVYESKVKKWKKDDMTLDAIIKNLMIKLSDNFNFHTGNNYDLRSDKIQLVDFLSEFTITFE